MRTLTKALAAAAACATLTAMPAVASAPDVPDGHRANSWFPLKPGTVWVLRGYDEGHRFLQRTTVTDRHRMVDGVRTRVVRDVVRRADGSVAELTNDWYAVDDRGTVWYYGEATATYDRQGRVISRNGSWEAGVDGAVAGRIMPAHPLVTTAFRQEFRPGLAEDQAWVVERGARVRTPGVTTAHGMRMLEWTRLEPDTVSQKLYVRGYGLVAERDLAGSHERFELIRMVRPGRS
jgi:hypothetical protein